MRFWGILNAQAAAIEAHWTVGLKWRLSWAVR